MKVLLNSIKRANTFFRIAEKMESDIYLKSGRYVVNGKSIMGIFSIPLEDWLILEVDEKVEGETKLLIEKLMMEKILVETGEEDDELYVW